MSRFFAAVGDSYSENSGEEEEEVVRRQVCSYSSDEENVKRVVKTTREKYQEELRCVIQHINNHKKIKDYSSLLSSFDELCKIHEKVRFSLISSERFPPSFLACVARLAEFINAAWDDSQGRKALSKTGYKSLAVLRQKLRKFVKPFEEDINSYKANSESFDADNTVGQAAVDVAEVLKSSESSSGSSDLDSDDGTHYDNIRDRFLKKSEPSDGEPKRKERREKRKQEVKRSDDEEGEWKTVAGNVAGALDQKLFAKDADISVSSVMSKMREILKLPRLKRSDRMHRIHRLQELSDIATQHELGAGLKATIVVAQILVLYDYNISALEPMKAEIWDSVLKHAHELIDLLTESNLKVDDSPQDDDNFERDPSKVTCSLSGIIIRLVDEFHKILKSFDPFKSEYVEKFKDESQISVIIDKALTYCQRNCQDDEISRVMLCKIEHIYYKVDRKCFDDSKNEETSLDVIDQLSKYIFAHDKTQRLRTRAILMKIYHLALHNKWTLARDLFLMSNLQNGIQHADPASQILYNRALIQLGLCAFRIGNFIEAQNCLADFVTSGRLRELLGQGLTTSRNIERTHEQEMREKQYQTPFHMTINLDVIDTFYLITSMLIDIPNLVAKETEPRRKLISKHFYLQLRMIERLTLVGPPESVREHIVAASNALKQAKWQACCDFIINPKMRKKVWNLIAQPFSVEDLLLHTIKKECLKIYIYAYQNAYECINRAHLAAMFELTPYDVDSTIKGMILEGDLGASINAPENCLVFHKSCSKSFLQIASYQLVDKLTTLVDCNERCLPTPR